MGRLEPAPTYAPQRLLERRERQRVEHVAGRQPGAAGDRYAPPSVAQRRRRVGVRVDRQLDAAIPRQPSVVFVDVETVRLAVDLDGDARGLGGVDDALEVEGVRFPLEEHPAGWMSQHVDPRA